MIEVRTQEELDAAVTKDDGKPIRLVEGSFHLVTSLSPWLIVEAGASLHVVARESSQPRVEARGSSQPHVEARGSSQPHVVAWESSQPRVEAWESSQPRVEARGSSQPHVVAWGFVQLSIFGRVIAKCASQVAVLMQGEAEVEGGQQTRVSVATAAEWCDYYGVSVTDGVAVLYKAVDDNFTSPHGICYAPGTQPEAPDWDGGERECGGGLHFSPAPAMARAFNRDAARFVGCPVAVSDIVVHPEGSYPEKVKAPRVCAPCFEVDEDGDAL